MLALMLAWHGTWSAAGTQGVIAPKYACRAGELASRDFHAPQLD